jgi:hypothetical protein
MKVVSKFDVCLEAGSVPFFNILFLLGIELFAGEQGEGV